ncbi:hypothetical protein LTR08_002333 [Meristemomyces frigidus]|nr:hypothetical protein LTR08_002333 [Meristemomyces frigidus]
MADNATPAASTMATTTSSKRKRAQVSYLDDDSELDELLGVDDQGNADQDTETAVDDDMTYGSRKQGPSKTQKSKARAAKKAKTASTKAAKNYKPFPFMRLPAELRDIIYEMALTDPAGITLIAKTKDFRRTVGRGDIPDREYGGYYRRRRQPPPSQETKPALTHDGLVPALLAVNKQIHSEALGYLYQQPLVFTDTHALHSFLCVIGTNRAQATHLTVKGWGHGRGTHHAMNAAVFPLLGLCTKLETLFLDCEIGWIRNPQGLARQIFRDGHHFFEAYGSANGSKDAGVDVLELRESNFDRDLINGGWRDRNKELPEKREFKTQFRAELTRLLGC